jgi:hypothetical protein
MEGCVVRGDEQSRKNEGTRSGKKYHLAEFGIRNGYLPVDLLKAWDLGEIIISIPAAKLSSTAAIRVKLVGSFIIQWHCLWLLPLARLGQMVTP